jgi:hypothetical protein
LYASAACSTWPSIELSSAWIRLSSARFASIAAGSVVAMAAPNARSARAAATVEPMVKR